MRNLHHQYPASTRKHMDRFNIGMQSSQEMKGMADHNITFLPLPPR
jgi:hypothetical protein